MLPNVKPLQIKDRLSLLYVEKGQLDVQNGAFVVIDKTGVRTHIPVGSVACLMLEPGCRVSHAAVALAARAGCLLMWTGEAGVRLYAAGQPGGASGRKLLYQASLALDCGSRLNVVRKMYELRFREKTPANRSIDQLRGIEGVRVKRIYENMAKRFGLRWQGRKYDVEDWDSSDILNKCLSSATAALYGVTESAVLAAGYAPSIGFIHVGKPLSFVYDIADIVKFDTVIPVAFSVAAQNLPDADAVVRRECRDAFRRTKLLQNIIPMIEDVLDAGGKDLSDENGVVGPAFSDGEKIGNDGHRG